MPLTLELTHHELTHIDRLLNGYQGTFKIEMMRAIRDIAKLKERVAQLETAAAPVAAVAGGVYDEKAKRFEPYVRVPNAMHAALAEAVRA